MIKTIEINVISHDDDGCVRFTVKNSHRGKNFGVNGTSYFDGSVYGLSLQSEGSPELTFGRFYVQGSYPECDDNVLKASRGTFIKIMCLVNEYNACFGSNTDKTISQVWDTTSLKLKTSALNKETQCFISPLVVLCQWHSLPTYVQDLMKSNIPFLSNAKDE